MNTDKTRTVRSWFGRGWAAVARWWRRAWCRHDWADVDRQRYAVTRDDGSKEGEVTLTFLACTKCGLEDLRTSDRTHLSRRP